MRQSTIVLLASVLCAGLLAQCGKPKPAAGSDKGNDGAPAMGMDRVERPRDAMRAAPGMDPAPPVTAGPTGIKECDTLLEMLAKCQKQHAALKIAFNTVKKDAVGWRAKALKRDPKQIAELAKACVRTAKEVGESFPCK